MTNTAAIEVQIPVQLAIYALTKNEIHGGWCEVRNKGNKVRPWLKPIAFYLLLKAQSPESGWIQNYAKQIPELSAAFGISVRSFYQYLSKLEDIGLVERKSTSLRIPGWKAISRLLYISTEHKITIQYNLYDKFTLHLWFSAIEIEYNQELQAAELWRKLNQNSLIKYEILSALCKRGFKYEDRDNRDKFITAMFTLSITDFAKGTEVHDYLINFRSDLNRSVTTIAAAWDVNTSSLVSYYKRLMTESKIIAVTKIAVMSEYSRDSKECHKNKYCHVIWNEEEKERVWFLCDQITILKPWTWQGFLSHFNEKTAA